MSRGSRIGLAAAVLALLVRWSPTGGRSSARVGERERKPTLAGIAKSLVRDGAPVRLSCFARGDESVVRQPATSSRDPRVAWRDRTVRIASVTKPFVATVVLELVGEGELGLYYSVERWLPSLVPNGGNVRSASC